MKPNVNDIKVEEIKHYIIGTGSQARYVIEIYKERNMELHGLVDIETNKHNERVINGQIVRCGLEEIVEEIPPTNLTFLTIAYGNNSEKERIAKRLSKLGYSFHPAVSRSSYISNHVNIGEGTIINPNVTIMPNTRIGEHVIIHSGSVIEHDNIIEDFANISPAVITGGNVHIGKGCYIYTGVKIIPKISIGDYAIVGAGAVVIRNVEQRSTVVGVPARKIK